MKPRNAVYVLSILLMMMTSLAGVGIQASSHETAKSSATAMTDGEVKKVNKDAGKITIKHGPLTNLDMPAMTMVFRVKDPAMLDQVKEGDKPGDHGGHGAHGPAAR